MWEWTTEDVENETDIVLINDHITELGEHLVQFTQAPSFKILINNMTWNNMDGTGIINLYNRTPLEVGKSLIPDYDCTIELKQEDGETEITGTFYSHDKPTGAPIKIFPFVELELVQEDIISELDLSEVKEKEFDGPLLKKLFAKAVESIFQHYNLDYQLSYDVLDEGDFDYLIEVLIDGDEIFSMSLDGANPNNYNHWDFTWHIDEDELYFL